MPRPKKCRRICAMPPSARFEPAGGSKAEPVVLTVEEFELLRLLDLEQYTQAQCAAQMQVARATVQADYDSARRKVALALAQARPLEIAGGEYQLCPAARQCPRRQGRWGCPAVIQGGTTMKKIAVTYDNGLVFQHFGHSKQFKVYDVEEGKVVSSQILSAGESGHGALAGLLAGQGVDTLVCGGIGGGARTALAQAGIQLYPGVSGLADAAVDALLAGTLAYNPDTVCAHHEGHGHEEGHDCGHHGHSCGGHCGH